MSRLPFNVSTDLPLHGETHVFTGRLWSLSRKDHRAAVARLGGSCEDEVTPQTTLLVVVADTFPSGVPDERALTGDSTAHAQKILRKKWSSSSATLASIGWERVSCCVKTHPIHW